MFLSSLHGLHDCKYIETSAIVRYKHQIIFKIMYSNQVENKTAESIICIFEKLCNRRASDVFSI